MLFFNKILGEIMSENSFTTEQILEEKAIYPYGFVTDIATETFPKGLSEETVRAISAKKEEPQFLLDFRL